MKKPLIVFGVAMIALATAFPAAARDRYAERPPVVVSPDLSAPWVMQLRSKPGKRAPRPEAENRRVLTSIFGGPNRMPNGRVVRRQAPDDVRTAGIAAPTKRQVKPQMDPIYLPQIIDYQTKEKPGTIVIDTVQNFLYLVQADGKARRYGVGTGKPGFEWAGTHKITRKAEWPDWRPPAEMIAREKAKGRFLPAHLPGGPENPMGARGLYLGSTLYRIHGTNQPWTIGGAVSSGCIRMRNEDVIDLYERVGVGTKVIVI
ncbi:MAG TPA: L,D-transpeptidase [Rhizobiaceae bacterium]|nr:L,D-transpeptidase [Rhizobiaceae bacterium]